MGQEMFILSISNAIFSKNIAKPKIFNHINGRLVYKYSATKFAWSVILYEI